MQFLPLKNLKSAEMPRTNVKLRLSPLTIYYYDRIRDFVSLFLGFCVQNLRGGHEIRLGLWVAIMRDPASGRSCTVFVLAD